jgi:hypothetical protein
MLDRNRRRLLTSSLGAAAVCSLGSPGNSAWGDSETKSGAKSAAKSDSKTELKSSLPQSVTGFVPGEPPSIFLTWWRDPTTTMVIQWIGPAQANSVIHYGVLKSETKLTAQVQTKAFPDSPLKVHRCELSGLRPGTEYQFAIDDSKRNYRFRTMPAKATNTFAFVSGGDCGIGSAAVATNVLAAAQEPYFALIGGDLAYDNGKAPNIFLWYLENYSKSMRDPQGRMIPMVTCIGNHETTSASILNGIFPFKGKPVAPSYLSVFDGIFANNNTYGVLDFADYLSLVLLDTNHLCPIKGAQTEWLARVLAERQLMPHLLVANHVPAYPSYRPYENTGKDNRKYWSPLFEKYNVDAVLEHHDHTIKRTHPLTDGLVDKNGVLYLGDGSWGKIRALKKPEERPYLATYGDSYHVSLHRLEGDQRYHIALGSSGKIADICTTHGKRVARRG